MLLVRVSLCIAALLPLPSAHAQGASGAFDAASPGALGNAGGTGSDFQSLREQFVKKMRDGSYAEVVRQGRENMETFQRPRDAERRPR
jgi:hypothetical protein